MGTDQEPSIFTYISIKYYILYVKVIFWLSWVKAYISLKKDIFFSVWIFGKFFLFFSQFVEAEESRTNVSWNFFKLNTRCPCANSLVPMWNGLPIQLNSVGCKVGKRGKNDLTWWKNDLCVLRLLGGENFFLLKMKFRIQLWFPKKKSQKCQLK